MNFLDEFKLVIIGDGDIKMELKSYLASKSFSNNVEFKEAMLPEELKLWTSKAMFGLNLIENYSHSYYYSLANKFFDYMYAEVPSVNMDFPEYRAIITKYGVGVLISDLDKNEIADNINLMLRDQEKYSSMKSACGTACDFYNWDHEEKKLGKLMESLSERT